MSSVAWGDVDLQVHGVDGADATGGQAGSNAQYHDAQYNARYHAAEGPSAGYTPVGAPHELR
jgi:hypothetical protein